jgi:DNA polymerase (family 10)
MSLNHELADLFKTFAAVMEIRGESVFKAIAFTKVARILNDMTLDVKKAFEDGTLQNVEGVGASSFKIIADYITTGHSPDFEEVAKTVPPGLIPMLNVPGLGPKTISLLWKHRGITSIDELTKAIDEGRLEGLKGIGDKKIQAIKDGLAMREQAGTRMGIGEALPIAIAMVGRLQELKHVRAASYAGSLRRCRETIGDLDLLIAVDSDEHATEIASQFVKFEEVARVNAEGQTKCSVVTREGLQVDLRIVPEENFGAALMYFTGSKEHNVRLRGMANDKKWTLNEWGLYRIADYEKAEKEPGKAPKLKPLASRTEEEVYQKLGLAFIEPELREDRGEIDAAIHGTLPKLITLNDYRGDLHCHTTASDGVATIEQMAEAAIERGYEFLAITDHSKSQVVANGLSAERLLKHADAIRRVGAKLKGITLLAGCEVDILADGHLDYDDDVLKELDFIVASPHTALKQETTKCTDRLLRAIENPYVNVIGHPTGRLINAREGLPLDFERIFQACVKTGTALEINAGYPRLDLTDTRAFAARAAGVKLSINTDAHSAEQLDGILLGMGVARRAWLEKSDVINCWSAKKLLEFIRAKRP